MDKQNPPYDNWATDTSYAVGNRRKDPSGGNYECCVAHTSGTKTMKDDRDANPGHWKAI